jgi:hypothetical protein
MNKVMTLVFAMLFAASTSVFAAAHMKGEKDAPKADAKADAKKGGDMKSEKSDGKGMKKDEKAKK